MLPVDTRLLADPEAVAIAACHLISAAAAAAIAQRQIFRLVLAGGTTPGRIYQWLATTTQQWAAWEIFWGDERCLPADEPGRNSRMAQMNWLDHVAIPAAQIHPIPAELGAARATAKYAEVIRNKQPFDLVLLGIGEDGHTASLFPGRKAQTGAVIAVHDAPKPPALRVSLNFETLRACRQQIVIVTGSEKAGALAAWQQGQNLPIAQAVRSDACLLLDVSATRSADFVSPII
jgi:6-phosphogluconolactonase